MRDLFCNAAAFNHDIGGWDVGAVQDMQSMFHGAAAFGVRTCAPWYNNE